MASWQDVETVLWAWLRGANEPAWLDLEQCRATMDCLVVPLPHTCPTEIARGFGILHEPSLCGICNDRIELALFLEERAAATAEGVRPELRMAAANRSALKSRGW